MPKHTVNYKALYEITSGVTPLEGDCGILCERVCCRPDESNTLGMYLFPGEENMFTGEENWLEWERRCPEADDFPPSWRYPVHFIRCTRPCPRERRPLSCRFFPLAPHLLKDGTLLLIYETMALPYTCPLIEKRVSLKADFVEAVARCWQELLKDPRIRSLVELDSRDREREEEPPCVAWAGSKV